MISVPIPSMEQLGLPAACMSLLQKPQGLFLVTGPDGSGKSTSIRSMILRRREMQKNPEAILMGNCAIHRRSRQQSVLPHGKPLDSARSTPPALKAPSTASSTSFRLASRIKFAPGFHTRSSAYFHRCCCPRSAAAAVPPTSFWCARPPSET